ncbi:ion transporter [Chryseobacterium sp.]|uniref:ion transporter n=1 Tax=Chryseobacterium sp. TaxID=1871047 RepID=UPI0011C9D06A|nr:ion transporter [Chryseobacterium sp.]TXF77646.1 ion transporter [Chryseobacterium sp.]
MKPEYDLIPEDHLLLKKIYRVIYFSDTKAGKIFDISLLLLILFSTVLLMLETVPQLDLKNHHLFYLLEFIITIFFTVEYLLRIFTIKDKNEYIFSFFGIIDLLAIIPFYISLLFPVAHFFIIIRMLRMLRIFRIFNLADYMHDGQYIMSALRQSSRKIYIFLLFLSIFIVIIGAVMYVVEDGKNGFNSIPQSIYWAVVTITTVGYGDISPVTSFGKFLSVIVMLCGYSIIAVPTGIVTSEFRKKTVAQKNCSRCGSQDNDADARYCKQCGDKFI